MLGAIYGLVCTVLWEGTARAVPYSDYTFIDIYQFQEHHETHLIYQFDHLTQHT